MKKRTALSPPPPPQATLTKKIASNPVCKCCGVRDRNISGCSCLGGTTTHECQHESKTLLTTARLTSVLSEHFNEINLTSIVEAYLSKPFISRWAVGNTSFYILPMHVTLPLTRDGKYDFMVDWGDKSSDYITTFNQAEVTHVYAAAGEYVIQLNGIVDGFTFAFGRNLSDSKDFAFMFEKSELSENNNSSSGTMETDLESLSTNEANRQSFSQANDQAVAEAHPMESTSNQRRARDEAWEKLDIELRTALESAQQSNQELNTQLDEKEQILGVTQVELKQQTTNASSARMVLEAAQGNFAEQLNNLENQLLQITRERDELKNVVIEEEVELKVAHKEIEADEGQITEYIHLITPIIITSSYHH